MGEKQKYFLKTRDGKVKKIKIEKKMRKPVYTQQKSRDDLDMGTYDEKKKNRSMVIGKRNKKKGHFDVMHSKKYKLENANVTSPIVTKDDILLNKSTKHRNLKHNKQKPIKRIQSQQKSKKAQTKPRIVPIPEQKEDEQTHHEVYH